MQYNGLTCLIHYSGWLLEEQTRGHGEADVEERLGAQWQAWLDVPSCTGTQKVISRSSPVKIAIQRSGSALCPTACHGHSFRAQWSECGSNHLVGDNGRIVKRLGVDGDGTQIKVLDGDLPMLISPVEPDRVARTAQHCETPFR